MDKVKDWLRHSNLIQYADSFEECGYDSIEAVCTMDEEDISFVVPVKKVGHKKLLWKKVSELKTKQSGLLSSIYSTSQVPTTSRCQDTNVTSHTKIMPKTENYKKLKVWFKNPSSAMAKFSNKMLPPLYAVAGHTKPQFETYFRGQVKTRWEQRKKFDSHQKYLEFIKGFNPAAVGRFLISKPHLKASDNEFLQKTCGKMSEKKAEFEITIKDLEDKLDSLYESGHLRSWASDEKHYIETAITDAKEIKNEYLRLISNLEKIVAQVDDIFHKVKQTSSAITKRKQKECRHHQKVMKIRRQLHMIQNFLDTLGIDSSADVKEIDITDDMLDGDRLSLLITSEIVRAADFMMSTSMLSFGAATFISTYLIKEREVVWQYA